MELFATFDRQGEPMGLVPRAEVHRLGLWHKSAHVFIFDEAGRLLMQRRARDKDLYAGLWDYSVGEHLQPQESFAQGAQRGLFEELGIIGAELEPLGGERWVEIVGEQHTDREIQQAYRCSHSGPLRPDPVEVDEVRYIRLADLQPWVEAKPAEFTPWFVADLQAFGFFD